MTSWTGWQNALATSFVGTDPALALDLSLISGEERLRLRVRNGRLELIEAEDAGEPDLSIRFRSLTLSEVLLGTASTCNVFRDAEMALDGRWCPVLPAAEQDLPRRARFERIPGASLSVAIHLTSTMFGEVGIHERWHDGALVSSELLAPSQLEECAADVCVSCSLAQFAAIRRQELTFLDFLAKGAGILGDWPQLMCFAELVQHPAYLAVWDGLSTVAAQAAWGAVVCSPAYGDAAQQARAHLDSVVGH